MSKFINDETIAYLKKMQGDDLPQQIQSVRERLGHMDSGFDIIEANIDTLFINQEKAAEARTDLENRIYGLTSRYKILEQDLLNTQKITNSYKKLMLIVAGGVALWLTTLSILILRNG